MRSPKSILARLCEAYQPNAPSVPIFPPIGGCLITNFSISLSYCAKTREAALFVVMVSPAFAPRLEEWCGEHLMLRSNHRQYSNKSRQEAYHTSRDSCHEVNHEEEHRERANQERRDYDREYESDQ